MLEVLELAAGRRRRHGARPLLRRADLREDDALRERGRHRQNMRLGARKLLQLVGNLAAHLRRLAPVLQLRDDLEEPLLEPLALAHRRLLELAHVVEQ